MQRRGAFWVVLMLAMAPAVVRAQQPKSQDDMVDGRWRGWIQQGDQDSIRITYTVQHYNGHILINLAGRSGINYDMGGVKVKDDVLTFEWFTSTTASMHCRLSRRDTKTFEGICDDRSPGATGQPVHLWMTMSPPTN